MPKTIKIAGLVYDIVFPYTFAEDNNNVGLCCPIEADILIADVFKDKKRVTSSIHKTLLHEITHGIDHLYCDQSIEADADIDRFATGWYDVLVSNNLQLNRDNYFPKKLKIGGMNYDVVYPYKVEDSRHMYAVNFEAKRIRLYGEKRTSPYCEKHAFIGAILYVIRAHYGIEDPFSDNGSGNILFSALTSGFHQVLTDNDLEKVMKSGA